MQRAVSLVFWRANSEGPRIKSGFGWFEMSDVSERGWEASKEFVIPTPKDFGKVANELCEKALNDAKVKLHPLVRSVELNRLDQRTEFVQAFKLALERGIARKLSLWHPDVQAVFKFDEMPLENIETWDGSIHLLVKIPRLSNAIKILGKKLDSSLMKYLQQLGWSRFGKRQSILEIQQVTPNELRHGVSYGAMFFAVHNVPVKVWPPNRRVQ